MEIREVERIQNRISDIIQKTRLLSSGRNIYQPQSTKSVENAFWLPARSGQANIVNRYRQEVRKTSLPIAPHSSFHKGLQNLIRAEAHKQRVSPELVNAVVQVESGGRPYARSSKGALGLMQLMPGTAKLLGVNPRNPRENLGGGIRYLRNMARRFGDLDLALAAYNAGPGAVEKYKGVPPYKETHQYIQKVRQALR